LKVTIQDLVQAGVHFGHEKRKWDPKMQPYILGERAGVYIIDLRKTLHGLKRACDFLHHVGRSGGGVLFVGTKKQAQRAVTEAAEKCGMYYVRQRWLGGTLTNFVTVKRSIDRMKEMERQRETGEVARYTKKELSSFNREYKRLEKSLGGIKQMPCVPEALVVIDTQREKLAVAEANRLNIPVVAIVDTKCDPDPVDYVIAANDDAIKSSKLLFDVLAESVWEGVQLRMKSQGVDTSEMAFETRPEEDAPVADVPAQEEVEDLEEPKSPQEDAPEERDPAAVQAQDPVEQIPTAVPSQDEVEQVVQEDKGQEDAGIVKSVDDDVSLETTPEGQTRTTEEEWE